MIFVTVGTQLPFDRMLAIVDTWAQQVPTKVFAQTGPAARSFEYLECAEFLAPAEFDQRFSEASLVVAHAGMGSILTALSYGKPLIIVPRRADLGEHRNDHQMATAQKFQDNPAVHIAWNESELLALLNRYDAIVQGSRELISPFAPAPFLEKLKQLIEQ